MPIFVNDPIAPHRATDHRVKAKGALRFADRPRS